MSLPKNNINAFFERLTDIVQEIDDAWNRMALDTDIESPHQLVQPISDLSRVVREVEIHGIDSKSPDLEILCDYGQTILDKLVDFANEVHMPDVGEEIERLILPYATWIARNGGELKNLPPIVNALAYHANNLQDPEDMAQLCDLMNTLIEAVSPSVIEDDDQTDLERPWRILLLNRAIVDMRKY